MGRVMVSLTPTQFHHIRSHLPAVSKSCLRDVYGISETTWRRLRDGRPIRAATFHRLMHSVADGRMERNGVAPLRSGGCGETTGNMIVVSRTQFLELRNHLPAATKACLQETYGISEGTWRRMREGQPIRLRTFSRIMKALDARREQALALPV